MRLRLASRAENVASRSRMLAWTSAMVLAETERRSTSASRGRPRHRLAERSDCGLGLRDQHIGQINQHATLLHEPERGRACLPHLTVQALRVSHCGTAPFKRAATIAHCGRVVNSRSETLT